jgi:hypothetical protein
VLDRLDSVRCDEAWASEIADDAHDRVRRIAARHRPRTMRIGCDVAQGKLEGRLFALLEVRGGR